MYYLPNEDIFMYSYSIEMMMSYSYIRWSSLLFCEKRELTRLTMMMTLRQKDTDITVSALLL